MCEIAPFKMECDFEQEDCLMCRSSKLNNALNEFNQNLPIVGKFIKDYRCPNFVSKKE